jgi:RNA polymerase sigma factor (sigma-70 family)
MKLILKNQKLLYKIAFEIYKKYRCFEYEDLKQEAVLKAIHLLKKYDPARAAFSTYIYLYVKQHLKNMCLKQISYRQNKKQFYVEIHNNQDDYIFDCPYNEEYDAIILRADIDNTSREVRECLSMIFEPHHKKLGRGIKKHLTKNELVQLMRGRINKPYRAIAKTEQFVIEYLNI